MNNSPAAVRAAEKLFSTGQLRWPKDGLSGQAILDGVTTIIDAELAPEREQRKELVEALEQIADLEDRLYDVSNEVKSARFTNIARATLAKQREAR